MTHREQSLALLVALLDLVRAGVRPDVDCLAGRVGFSLVDTRASLDRLGSVGLVTMSAQPRLSMTGLALATSLVEEREQRRFHQAA